jgi:hypothetical protein
MEGTRLSHTLGGFRQITKSTTLPDYDPTSSPRSWLPPFTPKPHPVHLPAGNLVFTSLRTASLDPAIFPNPLEVDLNRDMDLYCQWGWGPHTCAGMDVSKVAMTAMLKVVGGLDGLRVVGEGVKSCPTLFGYVNLRLYSRVVFSRCSRNKPIPQLNNHMEYHADLSVAPQSI